MMTAASSQATARTRLAWLASAVLALASCVGPGLEPPSDKASVRGPEVQPPAKGSQDAGAAAGGTSMHGGSGGQSNPTSQPGGGSGSGGNGEHVPPVAQRDGGTMMQPADAGDEDAGQDPTSP